MIKFTHFGHSCFLVEGAKGRIIIDPFLRGNTHVRVSPAEIVTNAILVTNAHSDHLGDAIEISQKNHAPVIGVTEVVQHCIGKGASGHAMNIGGSCRFEFGEVFVTPSLHSPGLVDGVSGGAACGFVVRMDNRTLYHAGASALSMEMKLIGEMHNIDVAFLPIGDNYTMGPADAAKAVEFLKPKLAVPMHYNTFPEIQQDPAEFEDKVGDLARVKIMNVGETYEL